MNISHSEGLSPPDSPLWVKEGSVPLLPGWGPQEVLAVMGGLQVLQERRRAARGPSPPDMPSARERRVSVTCDADKGLLETFLSSYLIVTPQYGGVASWAGTRYHFPFAEAWRGHGDVPRFTEVTSGGDP